MPANHGAWLVTQVARMQPARLLQAIYNVPRLAHWPLPDNERHALHCVLGLLTNRCAT